MPLLALVRLPLPNLRTYAIISFVLFTIAIFHALNWSDLEDRVSNGYDNARSDPLDVLLKSKTSGRTFLFTRTMIREPWCLLVLINQAYCCLMLFGKVIQKLIFGQLRIIEQQHAKDKFWNFVFYKFIYIFGVMNVQEIEEIVLWFSWFSLLGFLHILATLSKDRFEYNSSSPSVTRKSHAKVLALLTYLHITSWMLLLVSVYLWMHYVTINTFAFMMAESLMLIIKTLYVIIRYCIHLKDAAHEGAWESRATLVYYSDFIFEVSALFIDFLHHLHMLLYGNIFLSMASLVIGLQLKQLYYELKRRIKRHENYRRVVSSMETKFPMATVSELKENDNDCAICWEKMDVARKLPCGHMFHNTCLRSWLEQDTTCPTCRLNLRELQVWNNIINQNGAMEENPINFRESQTLRQGAPRLAQTSPIINPQNRRVTTTGRRTSYFHFDGSRILSWLPSFSVEVTQPNLLGMFGQNSTTDNMVQQVREIFPNFPPSVVREDLLITRSVEQTIDNIVEGRLVIPEGLSDRDEMDPIPSTSADDVNINQPEHEGRLTNSDSSSGAQHRLLRVYHSRGDDDDNDDDDETDDDNSIFNGNNIMGNVFSPTPTLSSSAASSQDWSVGSTSVANLLMTDQSQEEGQVADGIGVGFRFSKSSMEREKMLQTRKIKLLEEARKKYLQKSNQPPGTSKPIPERYKFLKPSTLLHPQVSDNSEMSNQRRDGPSSQNIRRRIFSSRVEGSPVDGVTPNPSDRVLGFNDP